MFPGQYVKNNLCDLGSKTVIIISNSHKQTKIKVRLASEQFGS